MLDPTYFQRPATYYNIRHPRLRESRMEQRPVKRVVSKPSTGSNNGGANGKGA